MLTRPVSPRTHTTYQVYLALTFTWSLAFWFLSTRFGDHRELPGLLLFYTGGAGPLIAALVLVHGFEPVAVRKDFWLRTVDPRRIRGGWWAAALLLHPALVLAVIPLDLALGGTLTLKTNALTSPGALLTLVLFVFIFGPLPEEMGWRGIALDRLQQRMSGLAASLVLAVAWALWHVSLFLIDGTFQHGLGLGSVRFWIFMADLVPLTILIHWVYNHTDRSTLAAALVHFSGNLCGALIDKSDRLAVLELGALTLAAIAVVVHDRNLGARR